jgi:hypothetical protein
MIRRIGLVSGVGAALLLGIAAPASAGTLDQQQTTFNTDAGMFATQSIAQTFTAGITGGLDRADLLIFKSPGDPTEPLTVEIRNTSAGAPGASVLASASVPTSAIGEAAAFVPVTFATPAAVTVGTRYALVAYNARATNTWGGWNYQNTTDAYAGGEGFNSGGPLPPQNWNAQPGDDYGFKTFVTPPAPGQPAKKKCKKKKNKKRSAGSAKKKCKKKKKKK